MFRPGRFVAMAIRKDTVQLSIEINGVKAGKTYKDLRQNARDLNRELEKLEPGTDAFIQKSDELKKVNNVLADIRKTTAGVASSFDEPAKKTGGLTSLFQKGAAAAAGFFAVEHIVRWGSNLVSWATKGTAALETSQRKTAIVFGQAIDLVEDYAAINAQNIGVTETQYASLASRIGDVIIPMGFQRAEAAKMSAEMTNLAAALATWSDGMYDTEGAVKILSKALVGQRGSLDELGIIITETEIKQELMRRGQEKLKGELLQQAKAVISYELILRRSQDAMANFVQGGDTIERTHTRIAAAVNRAKESLLAGLLPAYKRLTSFASDLIAPLKRQSDLVADLQTQFNVQIETLQRGNISFDNRKKLIDEINVKYKEYLPNLITEKTTLSELKDIQELANKAFENRITLLASEESLVDVRTKQIAAEKEEGKLAYAYTAALQKLNKELERAGVNKQKITEEDASGAIFEDIEGEIIKDQKFAQAFERESVKSASITAARIAEQIEANKKLQQEIQKEFDLTREAAKKLGLDISSILNPTTNTTSTDDKVLDESKKSREKRAFEQAEGDIIKLRNLRIEANDRVVQSDEAAALKRQIIEANADNEISRKRIEIFKNASKENERLTTGDIQDLQRKILDTEKKARDLSTQLNITELTELIETERKLRIEALEEEVLFETEQARKLEIINKESDLRIAQARLQSIDTLSAEYQKAQTEIAAKQKEIDKLISADQLATQVETIESRRDFDLQAIEQLKLDEEDYQEYRKLINAQFDKEILEARLKSLDPDSPEGAKVKRAIAEFEREIASAQFAIPDDVASSGGSSNPGDKKTKNEKIKEAVQFAVDQASAIASAVFTIERNRIEQTLSNELKMIDTIEKRKLAAAGNDAELQKKILAESERDRMAAEKRAAKERKKLARTEATIQGALSVIEALPNPYLVAAAIIGTGLQLAVIDSQQFYEGGPTGNKSLFKDPAGRDVAGWVHTKEWVAPEHMLKDPETGPVIRKLEATRRAKRGFYDGGFTSADTTPTYTSSNTFRTASLSRETSDTAIVAYLEKIYMATKQTAQSTTDAADAARRWPDKIKADVSYLDIEKKGAELNYIRGLSRS